VQASSITVTNSDFESGSGTNPQDEGAGWWTDSMQNGGSNNNDYLTGWNLAIQTYRFGGRWNPRDDHYTGCTDGDATPDPALMDGPQAAFLHWGAGTGDGSSTITSTNTVTTIEAGVYTLRVAVGSPNAGLNMDQVHRVSVAILANGADVANDYGTPPAQGTWANYTAVLDNSDGTHNGKALKIQLWGRLGGGEKRHVNFDNVRLDFVAIPEPATLGLLGLGALGLLARRKRK